MKILQIAPPWIDIPPTTYGGTESVIHNLSEELVHLGHHVTLFATANTKTSANLKYVFKTGLFQQNATWSLIQPALALPALLHYDQAFKLAERGNFDIVHAHLSAGTDIMKLKFLADCTVPAVATAHMVFPFDRWSNQDDEFVKYYGAGTNLIFISQTLANHYPDTFNKVGIVHNGLDLNSLHFNPHPQGRREQPYLTWLGKILPWKGLHLAIRAAKQANQRLIFAGVMDPSDSESKQYFDEQIKPHIDNDQIQFLGPADPTLKNELLGNATAFLSPVLWDEPFGMVTIESLATGTPVISFARGGATEILHDGQTGYLVQDFNQMVNKISSVSQLNRLACRQSVETHFSAQAMTQNYLTMYQKVINTSTTSTKSVIRPLAIKI